jgi:hypothetical protein
MQVGLLSGSLWAADSLQGLAGLNWLSSWVAVRVVTTLGAAAGSASASGSCTYAVGPKHVYCAPPNQVFHCSPDAKIEGCRRSSKCFEGLTGNGLARIFVSE